MNIPLVDLNAQYASIKEEMDAAVLRTLASGRAILGPEVKALEEEVAAYVGTAHAVGVASGTDALLMALLGAGIGPDDEVITTPFTFIATTESILHCGARPVFADIEPVTYNLDPARVEEKISPRTKAILPVHLYGWPARMDAIMEIAARRGLKVIEDCAQALGAEWGGKKVGAIGNVGCLSFFPAKNLGAFGDGGMVVTSDDEIAKKIEVLHKHGSTVEYYHSMDGYNSRLDALQAAILRVKLPHLEAWNERRRRNAALYHELLGRIDGIVPLDPKGENRPSCNYYTIRLSGRSGLRDDLYQHLIASGIQSKIYYPISLHLQEVYRGMGYQPGDFPESEKAQQEVLSLPMYAELEEAQIRQVAGEIEVFLEK